jgi:hypothetical protein
MKIEDKFLVEVSRCDFNNIIKEEWQCMDWDYILKNAMKHNVLQFIYFNLKGTSFIPKHYELLLKSHFDLKKTRIQIMINNYKVVLSRLHESGIKVVLLKGVYLAKKTYKDIALRSFGDMDILIKEKDSDKVFEILTQLGYTQSEFNYTTGKLLPLSKERLDGYEKELQHFGEFIKLEKEPVLLLLPIDVHHRLSTVFDSFCYNINDILERAVLDDIDGVPIYRMCNEDFLTHLCSHLYWHTQSLRDILDGEDARLLSYVDIREFIKSNNIDWQAIFERAKETNLDTALSYVLYHCQLIFGDVVPNEVYNSWDINNLREISNSIYDRWITRDTGIRIGTWKQDFIKRMFNQNRAAEALESFYIEYLEPILHRGAILKVVERDDLV